MNPSPLCPLCSLQEGQTAQVVSVAVDSCLQRRLWDIGLIAGTPVTCLQKSPAGDPVAYEVRGAVIAIRRRDAAHIYIRPSQ